MIDRIVIVQKPSRLDALIEKHLTKSAAKFFLESEGQSVDEYEREDRAYKEALASIRKQIPSDIQVISLDRAHIPNALFRDNDLIIACGPDGLFVNLAQYVGDQLVCTINPDPRTIAGFLMTFAPEDVNGLISRVREGKHTVEKYPFVKAAIGRDKVLWGINDVFLGRKDQASARYALSCDGKTERQSSSGIIVSTGVGATGWIRSIQEMVNNIAVGGSAHKLSLLPHKTSNTLTFVVREPFPAPGLGTSMTVGRVSAGKSLSVISEMPTGGYMFSDGIIERGIEWNAGETITVTVGERHISVIAK